MALPVSTEIGVTAPATVSTTTTAMTQSKMGAFVPPFIQIGTIFIPFIQNTNKSYQALATQMGRIADFFNSVQPGHQQIPQVQSLRPSQIVEPVVQGQQHVP